MIIGLGTDIVEVTRLFEVLKRTPTFHENVLGNDELKEFSRRYAANQKRGVQYLATRFAAKEAFGKAYGTGIVDPIQLTDVQVLNEISGKPYVKLSGKIAELIQAKDYQVHISLSDETEYAVATVIIEVS
jgi:holo-[acyl-carrier protein] synthase